MAKNTEIFFTKAVRFKPTAYNSADGTTAKQVFAPSSEGSRVTLMAISSTSATQKTVLLQVNDGTNISLMGHITVPAAAGTNGSVPVVSGLNRGNLPWLQIDSDGNPFIDLNYGMNLEAKLLAALSSGEQLTIVVGGGNYDE
ncbi:hypothetical protein [Mucilaginibacter auburnensis]|uniref:Uncharacterized protein n=1 Tax=Mucilaginibacter auburnensis TaxID=1457233 RepID=A0A2H9VNT5_9SPHI|nr:hypothetical protein [Mucilaginibacter auburnensis]PJJ79973.1 hypothetical protein CLV57_3112 [Mucilaginibacter auburnensis]